MLNSIGLDNDGIEAFVAHQLPYLAALGTPIVVSIAGKTHEEFVDMAARLDGGAGRGGDRTEHLVPKRQRRSRFRHRPADVRAGGRRRAGGLLAGRSWPS